MGLRAGDGRFSGTVGEDGVEFLDADGGNSQEGVIREEVALDVDVEGVTFGIKDGEPAGVGRAGDSSEEGDVREAEVEGEDRKSVV